jgi:hypothetical protein
LPIFRFCFLLCHVYGGFFIEVVLLLWLSGKLLLCAIDLIVFGSVCCLSVVNGKDCILVIRYQYAARLCSLWWLDIKLMVVFVVVGLLYISISKLEEFLIIRRSRKLMYPFFLCAGFICRFVCVLFIYLWMMSEFVYFVSYISRISSTYLV